MSLAFINIIGMLMEMCGVLLIAFVWLGEWFNKRQEMMSTAADVSRQAAFNRGDITREEFEEGGVPADGMGTMWHYGNLYRAGMAGLWPVLRLFGLGTVLIVVGVGMQIYAQWPR
jgi:hypothetical protein